MLAAAAAARPPSPKTRKNGPWPNALDSSPQCLWVVQQHLTEGEAKGVNVAWPIKGKEQIWLMDMNGKTLQTRESDSSNASGLVFGNVSLWVMSYIRESIPHISHKRFAPGARAATRWPA